jgi:glycosyltransferase involved in cell wall biosynthesis
MRQGKVFPERLRHLPNFVAAAATEPKGSPGGGVVYAGRLSDEKGVDVLIEAVAGSTGLRLDVAGDGPARRQLEAHAAALRARDRVTFHGRLDPLPLQDLLRASAVAAVPSRWYENMPLAVLEAFAVGLPVVATALGGIPELIEPGTDGDLVAPNDPAALGRSLSAFVEDPTRAFEMGRAARAKVERAYAPAGHLEGLTALYDEARGRAAAG